MLIVATDGVALLHEPPEPAVNVVVEPAHIVVVPEIDPEDGTETTSNVVEIKQPADDVYVMSAMPAVTPVTSPVVGLTVTNEDPLHVAPDIGTASYTVIVEPTHTWPGEGTIMPAGMELTV